MNIEIGEVFPSAIEEEGTVMDFVDDEFVFVIKDEVWTDEECQAMKHNPLTLDFVYKYDIAVFLLTLEDAVDTSDFIFNVHDNEYPEHLYRSFENGDGYGMTLYLINSMNTVCAKRRVRLSQGMSNDFPISCKTEAGSLYGRGIPVQSAGAAVCLGTVRNAEDGIGKRNLQISNVRK